MANCPRTLLCAWRYGPGRRLRRPARCAALAVGHEKHVLETLRDVLDDPEVTCATALHIAALPCVKRSSVMAAVLQTPTPPRVEGPLVATFDVGCEIAYALEVVMRAMSCPATRMFFYTYNITVDLLVELPFVSRSVFGLAPFEREGCCTICTVVTCDFPAIRAFKPLRRFEPLQLLASASRKDTDGLLVCLFAFLVLTLPFISLTLVGSMVVSVLGVPLLKSFSVGSRDALTLFLLRSASFLSAAYSCDSVDAPPVCWTASLSATSVAGDAHMCSVVR